MPRSRPTQASGLVAVLPADLRGGAQFVADLHDRGVLRDMAARFRVVRKAGFEPVDALIFLVYFFAARPAIGGLRGFDEMYRDMREVLARIGGRDQMITAASLSRLLGAVEPEVASTFSRWLLLHGANALPLLREPHVQSVDALGEHWHVVDYDPSREAYRERAPVEDAAHPPVRRRTVGLAAPGRAGRARGEVVMTQGLVQHAGSGLWLGVSLAPGNGDRRGQHRAAVDAVAEMCDALEHPRNRALLRCDGEFGGMPAISAAVSAGIAYLTRSASYQLLDTPEISRLLHTSTWRRVPDAGSGPVRYAADLGDVLISAANHTVKEDGSAYEPMWVRLVVSRYASASTGAEDQGAGKRIGKHVYELFVASGLTVTAWPAHDVVATFYGRIGQENRFAQADAELGVDRTHSWKLGGLTFALTCGLLVWNLRVVRGYELAPFPPREGPKPVTPAEVGPPPDGLPAPAPPAPAAPPPAPSVERSVKAAVRVAVADEVVRKALVKRGWRVDPESAAVTRAGGEVLVLSKVQVDHQSAVLRFRTPAQRYVSISVALAVGRQVHDLLPDRLPSRRCGPDPAAQGVHRPPEPAEPRFQPEHALFAPADARRLARREAARQPMQIRWQPAPPRPPPHPTLRRRPRESALARLTWEERLERHAERGPHASLEWVPLPIRQVCTNHAERRRSI